MPLPRTWAAVYPLRPAYFCNSCRLGRQGGWRATGGARPAKAQCHRFPHFSTTRTVKNRSADSTLVVEDFKKTLSFLPASHSLRELSCNGQSLIGRPVVLHGYLSSRREASKILTFCELSSINLRQTVQLVAVTHREDKSKNESFDILRSLALNTPVAVEGVVQARKAPLSKTDDSGEAQVDLVSNVEIRLTAINALNEFPADIIMTRDTVFPPEQRHLQLRTGKALRDALAFRSKAARILRNELCDKHGFVDIETPLLFKSTPEGAREFLVPTRALGLAYALPQSPQQYKQILMASGIPRYMQIAKCFRDEDLRADRQPEFTQVDLEMAFAKGEDVIKVIEAAIKRLWSELLGIDDIPSEFQRLTYEDAMSRYGSDKPDLRFGAEIVMIGHMLPVELVSKIGPLSDALVEAFKLPVSDDPQETRRFVNAFMESPAALPSVQNPEGQPGIFIMDSRKPLQGLFPFGFEAAEQMEDLLELQDGDLVVVQARKDAPFAGGSTPIGNLRLAMHEAAVAQGLLSAPKGFAFTWITDFPLFFPTNDADPGQGGSAGLSSAHHPFTAPKSAKDVDLLRTHPLQARADHYDLVVNGVELGGGSRRIHNSQIQEFVLRDVLKMSDERLGDFAHLLEVLRAGCPPHAGMALGFDRLIAVMLGRASIRDVIAFPKSGKGEDTLVKSPTRITEEQLKTYHLSLRTE